MKEYLNVFLEEQDEAFLRKHTQALMRAELLGTTPAWHRGADYIYGLLRENGFDAELIPFVADGKTVKQDKIMPLCWDASYGKLTVLSEWEGERVVADYRRHPFHLIRYSVATPKGGIRTRLVPFERMLRGENVQGALVLAPKEKRPTDAVLVPVLNAGAIGLVNGHAQGMELDPDGVLWANNCTETNSWFVNAGERDFIGFCVSPRTYDRLYAACQKGEVLVQAETDGRRYEGEMPAVTALLKGESEREFWLLAHTAEPLEDDNSAGVIACIHTLLALRKALAEKKIPPLKYSVRALFAPELYGYAAFAEHFGGCLKTRCIGAICVDGMPIAPTHTAVDVQFAAPVIPFYGNPLLEGIWREQEKRASGLPLTGFGDHWGDDCFMQDSSVGLPTVIPEGNGFAFWHNSRQKEGYIDYKKFAFVTAVYEAYAALVAAPDKATTERFLPTAAEYAKRRLEAFAADLPPRNGTDEKARLRHRLKIETDNLRAFTEAGAAFAAVEKAVQSVEAFAATLTPVRAKTKKVETPVFDGMENVVPKRLTVGVPHDLARVPLARRRHPFDLSLVSRVFSAMDGKKTLRQLVTEAEWDEGKAWTEEALSAFLETLALLAEFHYVQIKKSRRKKQ